MSAKKTAFHALHESYVHADTAGWPLAGCEMELHPVPLHSEFEMDIGEFKRTRTSHALVRLAPNAPLKAPQKNWCRVHQHPIRLPQTHSDLHFQVFQGGGGGRVLVGSATPRGGQRFLAMF